jgi:hypothetical protein
MPPLVIFHNPPKGAPKLPYVISRNVVFFKYGTRGTNVKYKEFRRNAARLVLLQDGTALLATPRSFDVGHIRRDDRALEVGYTHAADRALYSHSFVDDTRLRLTNRPHVLLLYHASGEPLFAWYPGKRK